MPKGVPRFRLGIMSFLNPPLQGEGDRAEGVVEGCHPIDGAEPLRLTCGQAPPPPGENGSGMQGKPGMTMVGVAIS